MAIETRRDRPSGIVPTPPPQRATFRNPIQLGGADPWLTWHAGSYFLATTAAVDVRIRRARRLGELQKAPDQLVWRDPNPERFQDVWAPEFHPIDAGEGLRWFLYYTAGDGREPNHRMYVVESAGSDPLGPYRFRAQLLTDPRDEYYAIDGTVLQLPGGRLYFIWCGRPCPEGQGLFISRMRNPWTLSGPRVFLPADGFGCAVVREGPATLQRGGRVFLAYSACSADTPDYCVGSLSADAGSGLLDPACWNQHPVPVFARSDRHGVYGPGHNSFFKSPDGTEDWIAYHAKPGTAISYADRSARAQPFTWNTDGTPHFGEPLPLDADIPVPSGEPADPVEVGGHGDNVTM